MKLTSFTEKMQTAGVGQQGASIFINHMPVDMLGVLLRDPFGGLRLDHELPGFRKGSFQLIVRDKTMAAAQAKMTAAIAAIATELEQDYPQGVKVKYVRQRHDPIAFPVTAGNLQELLVNIDVCGVLV
jgi:hypothetical protein